MSAGCFAPCWVLRRAGVCCEKVWTRHEAVSATVTWVYTSACERKLHQTNRGCVEETAPVRGLWSAWTCHWFLLAHAFKIVQRRVQRPARRPFHTPSHQDLATPNPRTRFHTPAPMGPKPIVRGRAKPHPASPTTAPGALGLEIAKGASLTFLRFSLFVLPWPDASVVNTDTG